MTKRSDSVPGPAWFKRYRGTTTKLRIFLRGWFTPLHGCVEDVDGNQARVAGRWITLTGRKCDVQSVEVIS